MLNEKSLDDLNAFPQETEGPSGPMPRKVRAQRLLSVVYSMGHQQEVAAWQTACFPRVCVSCTPNLSCHEGECSSKAVLKGLAHVSHLEKQMQPYRESLPTKSQW